MIGWSIFTGALVLGLIVCLWRGRWERKREEAPDFKGWWPNR
jgi:hypothetical protein